MSVSLKMAPLLSILALFCACSGSGQLDEPGREQAQGVPSAGGFPPSDGDGAARDRGHSVRKESRGGTIAQGLMREPSGLLATESTLVADQGVSAQVATDLLSSPEHLAKAVQKMERDASGSPEAQDLAKHYRSAISRAVGSDGAVENFSCGLSVCAGSVRSRLDVDQDAWVSRLNDDKSALTYSYVDTAERVGGFNEIRFVFSTDPALNAIVTPAEL